tara:strand:+ start:1029 stop:1481 length:453 start_codon:yes stop_codon:yes gene_type:complete
MTRANDTNVELTIVTEFQRIHDIDPDIASFVDGDISKLLDAEFVGAELESGGDLIGYAAFDLRDPHRVHLLRVFVCEQYRRIGIGTELAKSHGRHPVKTAAAIGLPLFALVPENAVDDQCFLRACGYRAVEIHEYEDDTADSFLMEYESE